MSRSVPKPFVEKIGLIGWSHVTLMLNWVYESEVNPENLSPRNHLSGQSGFLIRQGEVLISTEKGEIKAKAGHWVFPREGDRFQQFSPGSRILSIHFQFYWPGNQPFFEWDVAAVIPAQEVPELEIETKKLQRLIERNLPRLPLNLGFSDCDWETYLLIHNGFLKWVHLYSRLLKERGFAPTRLGLVDLRVLRMVQELDQHSLTEPFNEDECAKRLHLSAGQLGRLFVKQFGITPRHYLEKRRMDQAVARLQASSESIKQIAFDLGFRSLSHFSAWIRRKTNLSPRELREQGLTRLIS